MKNRNLFEHINDVMLTIGTFNIKISYMRIIANPKPVNAKSNIKIILHLDDKTSTVKLEVLELLRYHLKDEHGLLITHINLDRKSIEITSIEEKEPEKKEE